MNVKNENIDRRLYALQFVVAAVLILVAAAVRVLPHPMNFTPIGAMAIFSGSLLRNRWAAFMLPLAALFAGDLLLGLYQLMFIVYLSFAASVAIGRWLAHSRKPARIGGAVFLGALHFFVVTKFALWARGGFYPRTFAGLSTCFSNALPLFWNTLAGDIFYGAVLFGGYALAEHLFHLGQDRSVNAL